MKNKIYFYSRIFITTLMWACGAVALWSIFSDWCNNWYWVVAALVYSTVLNDVFCHRICSHGMFQINTGSITYKILTWLASVDMGYGPVKAITMTHNLHHIYADNGPLDNMNWRHYWYATTIVSPLPRFFTPVPPDYEMYKQNQFRMHKEILEDTWTDFCAKYQIEISAISLALLYFVLPTVFFNIVCAGRLLLSVMTGIAGSFGHMKNFPISYRNFNTRDTTSNNLFFHYLFLGLFAGILQNNHHGRPSSVSPNPNWWEIDSSKPFVLLLKKIIEKKKI